MSAIEQPADLRVCEIHLPIYAQAVTQQDVAVDNCPFCIKREMLRIVEAATDS